MNPSDSDEDYPGGGLGLDDDYDSDEELSDGMEYDLEPDDSELGEMGQEIRGLLKDSGYAGTLAYHLVTNKRIKAI